VTSKTSKAVATHQISLFGPLTGQSASAQPRPEPDRTLAFPRKLLLIRGDRFTRRGPRDSLSVKADARLAPNGWGCLVDLAVVSLLAALAGLAVHGIAIAQALMRLRWHSCRRLAYQSYLVIPGGELLAGGQLMELRANGGDGSQVHLMITRMAKPSERPS
jgi:hypothetical protein